MKIGFVFPGQGAQFVGMGKEIYENYEVVRNLYKKAEEILGINVAKLTFETTEEKLGKTQNTQIAILLMSLGILEILKEKGIKSDISVGLSLGEYTALIYSGAISIEDGVHIVKKRGELMANNVPEGNWSMAAVIGLEDKKVEEACQLAKKTGFVVPANYNCPGQVVISGEKGAVMLAMEKAKELGAKRAIELKTSGPFHTEKLKVASEKLREELNKIEINYPNKKVIKNIDAKEYQKDDNIKEVLTKHVISPVRFSDSVKNMIEQGVDTFIEIGPGRVLSGFIKKINKEVTIMNIQDMETLKRVIDYIEEN